MQVLEVSGGPVLAQTLECQSGTNHEVGNIRKLIFDLDLVEIARLVEASPVQQHSDASVGTARLALQI